MKVGKTDFPYLESNQFEIQGRKYLIVETEVTQNNAIHTVKNERGEYKQFQHIELMSFIRSNEEKKNNG